MSIQNKKTNFKNIIKKTAASASVLALLAGGATEALGGAARQTNGHASVPDGAGIIGGVFNNGDSIKFGGAHTLTTSAVADILAIDMNNNAAGPFTVAHNTTLGSVSDLVGGNLLAVGINADVTLTLDGRAGAGIVANTYDGLGVVTLQGAKSELNIALAGGAKQTVLTKDIDSGVVNGGGTVTIQADNDITFGGAIGATNAIGNFNLVGNAKATFTNTAVKAKSINIGAAGVMTADTTKNQVTITSAGDGIKLNDKSQFVAHLDDKNAGRDVTIKGNVVSASTDAQNGLGTLTITEVGGGAQNLSFVVEGSVGDKNSPIRNVELHKNHTFKITKDNASLHASHGVAGAAAGEGKVRIKSNEFEINANIGYKTDGTEQAVASVTLEATNNASKFTLAPGRKIAGPVTLDAAVGDVASLVFNGTEGNGNAALVTGTINDAGAGGKAAIVVQNVGEIKAGGAALNVGNAAPLALIDFTGQDAQLTVTGANGAGTIKATNIKFSAAGTKLILDGKQNLNIDAAVNNDVATAGNGKITWNPGAANVLTFVQAIGDTGDDAKLLGELRVTTGAVTLKTDAHIKNVVLDSGETLTLSDNAASKYRFGSVAVKNDTNTIKLANVTTLVSNVEDSNIGSSENRLANFDLNQQLLKVGDKVNIYATKATSTGGVGNLEFGGNSIFSAEVANKVVNNIDINAPAGSVVHFTEDLDVDNDVLFNNADGAIIQFSGETVESTAGGVIGNGGTKTGIVRLSRTAGAQTVDYAIGNKISDVQFIGGNVEFKRAFAAGGISFTENTKNNVDVTFAPGDLGNKGAAAIVVQNNSNFAGKLIVADDQNYGANFEVKGSKNTVFQMADDKTFTVGSTKMSKAVLTSKTADTVTVNMNVAGAVLESVGTTTSNRVKQLNFTKNGTVNNGVWSKGVSVDAGQVATLGGVVHSEGVVLGGAGSGYNFNSGATLDAPLTTKGDKNGVVNFAGNATLNGNIGTKTLRLSEINFAATADDKHVVELHNEQMHATNLSFGSGRFVLQEDLTLNGTSTLNSTNFDVASFELTSDGGGIVAKDDIKLSVDVNQSNGSITVLNGSTLDVDNLKSLAINVDQGTAVVIHGGKSFDLIDASGAKVTGIDQLTALVNSGVPVTVNGGTTFVNWNVTLDGNKLVLSQFNQIAKVLGDLGASAEIASDLAKPENARFVQEAQDLIFADKNLTQDQKNAKVKEKVERIDDQNQESANQELEQANLAASDQVNARMRNIDAMPAMSVASAGSEEGVAAGDLCNHQYKHGVWLSPFYRSAEQKKRKGVSGYDSSVSGLTFGVDTMVNNDLRIGAGFTYAHSDLKHQNVRKGDKTKIDSYLFSLYAMQYVTNNAFVQGVATIGANSVKSNSRRVLTATTYEVARAKHNSMSFSLEGMTGYNYVVEDFVLTPMAGLRFMRVNDGGYTETGTANQNLKVSRKAAHRFDIIAGGRVTAPAFMTADMKITPEAHAFVTHDFVGKNPQTDVRLDYSSVPFSKKAKNPAKTSYNLGLSANAEQGMMEYSLGYDFQAAEDFHAHQGTFKVRVNF